MTKITDAISRSSTANPAKGVKDTIAKADKGQRQEAQFRNEANPVKGSRVAGHPLETKPVAYKNPDDRISHEVMRKGHPTSHSRKGR